MDTVREALLAPVGADEHVPEATEVLPEAKAGPRRATLAEIEEAANKKRRDEDQRLEIVRKAALDRAVAALAPRVDEWLDKMAEEAATRRRFRFPYEDYSHFWQAVPVVLKTHRTETHELTLNKVAGSDDLLLKIEKRLPRPTVGGYVAPKPVETKESCVTM